MKGTYIGESTLAEAKEFHAKVLDYLKEVQAVEERLGIYMRGDDRVLLDGIYFYDANADRHGTVEDLDLIRVAVEFEAQVSGTCDGDCENCNVL